MFAVLLSIALTYCSIAVMGVSHGNGAWNLMPYCALIVMLLGNLTLLIVFLARLRHYTRATAIFGATYYLLLVVFLAVMLTHEQLFDTIQPMLFPF